MLYKIIVSQPSKGIERSLPYRLEDEAEIIALAGNLDGMLKRKGYFHRVEIAEPEPVKFERKGTKAKR